VAYFLDTNSIRSFGAYYPVQFPRVWEQIDESVQKRELKSVHEVLKELEVQNVSKHLAEWVKRNECIFAKPTEEELAFVAEIFKVRHFQQLLQEKQRLKGSPVADPFLIAAAKIHNGSVVTEEGCPPNGARIPNVCKHFGIDWTNTEGMMRRAGWVF